jgi:hypothetical protein
VRKRREAQRCRSDYPYDFGTVVEDEQWAEDASTFSLGVVASLSGWLGDWFGGYGRDYVLGVPCG